MRNITNEPIQLKKKIPKEVQKRMLEYFMHTSIPRRKAKNKKMKVEEQ